MPVIPERERQQIREIFDRDLTDDVQLDLYTQKVSPLFVPGRAQCESCPETEMLVQEVADLSDRLHLQVIDAQAYPDLAQAAGVTRVPTIVLRGSNVGTIRFLGPPAGYEFSTLITDLVDLSTNRVELSEPTQAVLKEISEPVHIQVFGTPT